MRLGRSAAAPLRAVRIAGAARICRLLNMATIYRISKPEKTS